MIREYAEIFCWKNVSSFCSAKATHIFSAKNIRILYIESTKAVNEMTLNELVKLTMLWTTGPRMLMFYKLHISINLQMFTDHNIKRGTPKFRCKTLGSWCHVLFSKQSSFNNIQHKQYFSIIKQTLKPLYNMVHYNMVLDITPFIDGSQKCIDYIEKMTINGHFSI